MSAQIPIWTRVINAIAAAEPVTFYVPKRDHGASAGGCRDPFKVEIAGSNPAGVTTQLPASVPSEHCAPGFQANHGQSWLPFTRDGPRDLKAEGQGRCV